MESQPRISESGNMSASARSDPESFSIRLPAALLRRFERFEKDEGLARERALVTLIEEGLDSLGYPEE
jgi:hypothetical protein